MLQVVFDGAFLLRFRVPGATHVARGQIKPLFVLPMPVLERLLCRVAELTDRQTDALTQLDEELHSPKPILV